MPSVFSEGTTSRLAAPSVAERDALLRRLGDPAAHAEALRTLPALRAVEVGGTATGAGPATPPLRIAAWNAERGRHLDAAGDLLAASGAQVVLLTELDDGMARTGQRHTTADLAARLGAAYAFGVEFVELGEGSPADHRADPTIAGRRNDRGLHGNAILSTVGLRRPAVVRLSDGGSWFGHERGEPRVGGRIAVVATIPLGPEGALVTASVHLESSSTPADRADELGVLLDALDAYAGPLPVVIGGDLNTCSSTPDELLRPGVWESLLADDPDRFVDPTRHEPLFAAAAARGYEWRDANVAGSTTRFRSGSRRWRYAMRLDWILTRGVRCSRPRTEPAVDRGDLDRPISDHDLLAVTVEPTRAT